MNKFSSIFYASTLTFIFFSLNVSAQNHSLSFYRSEVDNFISNFKSVLIREDLWKTFERKAGDLIEEMEEDLTRGSGLSFDEMNVVRSYKAKLQTLIDFGDGIATGAYLEMFNGRTLKRIREYIPIISFELFEANDCVRFYKVTFFDYVVIVARHNDKGILKHVSWWDTMEATKTLGGSFALMPGLYRQVWNNSGNLSYDGAGIIIKECEFKMIWDNKYSLVKPFVDN